MSLQAIWSSTAIICVYVGNYFLPATKLNLRIHFYSFYSFLFIFLFHYVKMWNKTSYMYFCHSTRVACMAHCNGALADLTIQDVFLLSL